MKTIVFKMTMLILSLFVLTTNVEAKRKKYPNGDVYVGKWKKGAPEGQGKLWRHNGEWCEGVWHIGCLTKGEYHMTDGIVFKGTWSDGMQNFQGSMTSGTSDVYEGEGMWPKWYEGTGHGKIKYASGAMYEGSWEKLKKHGNGTFTDVLGNRFDGEWNQDQFTTGMCQRADGILEDGKWDGFALQRGTRKYEKDNIRFVETVSGGIVSETKQILQSGTEYWPNGRKMKFDIGNSTVTIGGLTSGGKLKINNDDYYDVFSLSDSISFTGKGLDTFAIAKGSPEEIDKQLRTYCTAHMTTIKQQYAAQKAKEERELREQLEAERRAEEARQKIFYDMVAGQTYKTNDAHLGGESGVGGALLFGSMGAKLAYTFYFKSRNEVEITTRMDIPASTLQHSYELMILKSNMDKTETRRYEVKDGEICIYNENGQSSYKASVKNNGGYLDFSEGLSGSVVNTKGNKPTVSAKAQSKGNGWVGRRYRSDKVIFANKKLAQQYDSDMFSIVPTFTIQFDTDTEATLLITIELKKKPYVNLSQEQWELLTKQAHQKIDSRTQTYTISGGRLKMGAETFRIIGNGQSLVNDSPDFKGTVLRRIE